MPLFFYDATYILVIIGALLSLAASANVQSTFKRYSEVRSRSGLTGAQAATLILQKHGITNVTIRPVAGNLTDHYKPSNRTLGLSDPVMNVDSIAAIGVAAHEVGHAVQHARGFVPLRIRNTIVPVVNIGSRLSWPIILVGLLVQESWSQTVLNIGVILFALTTIFTLITLPVEFNASRRAVAALEESNVLNSEELKGTKKVLRAAALTYVAAAAASILSLLRILLITRSGRRRN
ncbi:MAG TPA: zinc metallopeptidase [Clostridiaceae bacterium]|nr:zinc metallopeptidase [Clostridiaceae bacterium]